VLATQGQSLRLVTQAIRDFCSEHAGDDTVAEFLKPLAALCDEWEGVTRRIGLRALANPEEVGAAAVDYLYFSGYVMLAWFWARMAAVAGRSLAAGTSEEAFYQAKIHTARFYFRKILPRHRAHLNAIDAGDEALMPAVWF